MAAAEQQCDAFISRQRVTGAQHGELAGLTFGVKDMYDVEGQRTGFGSPSWLSSHAPATATAPAVQALLDGGASMVGRTHCDELTYSLDGMNAHYGTPVNAAARNRIPGGSSSGSAAAVAACEVEFALGSDTAGSTRVPASYCGILGFRPSHGRISTSHTCCLAPSFDTVAWFARDADVLRRVGNVLLRDAAAQHDDCAQHDAKLRRFIVCTDAFAIADSGAASALYDAVAARKSGWTSLLSEPIETSLGSLPDVGELSSWFDVFRVLQGAEVWQNYGEWVNSAQPQLSEDVRARLTMASQIATQEVEKCRPARDAIVARVRDVMRDDGVLVVPSSVAAAPLLTTTPQQRAAWRSRTLSLTCIAGLARLPQVSLPIASMDGAPIGLGLIAPRGCDEQLLHLTQQIMQLYSTA